MELPKTLIGDLPAVRDLMSKEREKGVSGVSAAMAALAPFATHLQDAEVQPTQRALKRIHWRRADVSLACVHKLRPGTGWTRAGDEGGLRAAYEERKDTR